MKPTTRLAAVLVLALGLSTGASAGESDSDGIQRWVRFWTCHARGRIDANLYGTFTGYGQGQGAARKSALRECREIAQGCYITSCRPGL